MANFYILLVIFLGRYGVPISKFKELLPGYFLPIELPFHIGVKSKRLEPIIFLIHTRERTLLQSELCETDIPVACNCMTEEFPSPSCCDGNPCECDE